jgi:hypothetical protein
MDRSYSLNALPAGYRFCPTGAEAIDYMKKKNAGGNDEEIGFITTITEDNYFMRDPDENPGSSTTPFCLRYVRASRRQFDYY